MFKIYFMAFDKVSESIDTSNIFDEFEAQTELDNALLDIKNNQPRDKWYYIAMFWKIFQGIFVSLFLIMLLGYSYIFIQNDESINHLSVLEPICFLFLWNLKDNGGSCMSIAALNRQYQNNLTNLKATQTKEILSILEPLYKVENFSKTKELIFLQTESSEKLKVLDMLEAFDDLKNNFEPVEKQKIKCYDIEIDENQFFNARCEAYSAWYENEIKWFNGTDDSLVKGTSISIANSFLNFIEKTSKNFTLLDRQKIFSSENIIGESTGFTNKTVFYIKLKYISTNLSL